MGISWEEFWEMNPRIVLAHRKGYQELINEKNAMAHLSGAYVREALMATVGNMFKKSGSKPYEYPHEPYDLGQNVKRDAELTEADKEKQTQDLFNKLRLMQINFDLANEGE